MTDVATPTNDPASSPSAAPAGQKSPLDVLEEILRDSKAGAPAQGGTTPAAEAGAPTSAVPPEVSEAEIAAKEAEQNFKDQVALQAEEAELKTIVETPAYKARVQQADEKQIQEKQTAEAQSGFEIRQLEHTKIPDTPVSDS